MREALLLTRRREPRSLQHPSLNRLKDDKYAVMRAILTFEGCVDTQLHGDIHKFISARLLNDIDVSMALIDLWKDLAYIMLGSGLMTTSRLGDRDVVLHIINKRFDHILDIMTAISPCLKDDETIVMALVAADDPQAFPFHKISRRLQDNKKVVMAIITRRHCSHMPWFYANCISERLKDDKEVILTLLSAPEKIIVRDDAEEEEEFFEFWNSLSYRLQSDKDVIVAMINVCNENILSFLICEIVDMSIGVEHGIVHDSGIDNKDIVMAILAKKRNFDIMASLSIRMVDDKDVIMAMLTKHLCEHDDYERISPRLLKDRDVERALNS